MDIMLNAIEFAIESFKETIDFEIDSALVNCLEVLLTGELTVADPKDGTKTILLDTWSSKRKAAKQQLALGHQAVPRKDDPDNDEKNTATDVAVYHVQGKPYLDGLLQFLDRAKSPENHIVKLMQKSPVTNTSIATLAKTHAALMVGTQYLYTKSALVSEEGWLEARSSETDSLHQPIKDVVEQIAQALWSAMQMQLVFEPTLQLVKLSIATKCTSLSDLRMTYPGIQPTTDCFETIEKAEALVKTRCRYAAVLVGEAFTVINSSNEDITEELGHAFQAMSFFVMRKIDDLAAVDCTLNDQAEWVEKWVKMLQAVGTCPDELHEKDPLLC